jgi:hypothetical protein
MNCNARRPHGEIVFPGYRLRDHAASTQPGRSIEQACASRETSPGRRPASAAQAFQAVYCKIKIPERRPVSAEPSLCLVIDRA